MSFYEKSGAGVAGQNHRRTWDTKEFEEKASERLALEKELEDIKLKRSKGEPGPKRELLKARDYKVDLESKVGRTVVINKTTPSAESGGYYCDVCDCVVKDSINFLDHINGKNHQRNMGMSMKVKKSTVEEVRQRFLFKKGEKDLKKREAELEERLEELKEEEAKMSDYKQSKKQERKRKRDPAFDATDGREASELDPDMAAMMGFGGFGSSKK